MCIKELVDKVEVHRKAIASHRDELRNLYYDIQLMVDGLDETDKYLEQAIEQVRFGLSNIDYAIEKISEEL